MSFPYLDVDASPQPIGEQKSTMPFWMLLFLIPGIPMMVKILLMLTQSGGLGNLFGGGGAQTVSPIT